MWFDQVHLYKQHELKYLYALQKLGYRVYRCTSYCQQIILKFVRIKYIN